MLSEIFGGCRGSCTHYFPSIKSWANLHTFMKNKFLKIFCMVTVCVIVVVTVLPTVFKMWFQPSVTCAQSRGSCGNYFSWIPWKKSWTFSRVVSLYDLRQTVTFSIASHCLLSDLSQIYKILNCLSIKRRIWVVFHRAYRVENTIYLNWGFHSWPFYLHH